ncbi:DUF523 and DUF1722 domain-containing protein [Nocardiopsis halophila]|nr:DUF523 and DUF1722 domain-containing protein [Nocardiopsis halophila]
MSDRSVTDDQNQAELNEPADRPRIGVSSCLLGEPVRYNGGHCRDRFLTDRLGDHVDWVPVCPEEEIGLGVPRETLRLERSHAGPRVVASKSGTDHTDALRGIADRRREQLEGLDGYVLKNKSPSCGMFGLPVFKDGKRVDGKGRGAYADRLTTLVSWLPTEEEGRLSDADLRDHFVERVFAHARLRNLLSGDWRPKDLVEFHARHKLQIMAHSPEAYRSLGRTVAQAGARERTELAREYREGFQKALTHKATPGRHVNVLQHVFGMVSDHLDDERRHDILDAIESYRQGLVPLTLPVALVRHHCAAEGVAWAREQTYLAPFPADLGLRNALVKR